MRRDKKNNRRNIREAYLDYIRINKTTPTIKELSAVTDLSANTVSKHIDNLGLRADPTYRILTDDIVLGIYKSAMNGNAASQKLWFQVVEGWSEKTDHRIEGEMKIEQQPPVILFRFEKPQPVTAGAFVSGFF